MVPFSYLLVTITALSICIIGCRKKVEVSTPTATTYYHGESDYKAPRSGVFEGDDVLEIDVPSLGQTLFDDQMQQDLGITIFAEQLPEQVSQETRAFFRPLYFEYDQHTLKPGQSANLEHNIAQAKKLISQGYTIVLEGHACSSGGSESYNMQLSERRAQAIKSELVRHGIPADKITCVGRGTSKCLISHGTQDEQAPNRRVEMVGMQKEL